MWYRQNHLAEGSMKTRAFQQGADCQSGVGVCLCQQLPMTGNPAQALSATLQAQQAQNQNIIKKKTCTLHRNMTDCDKTYSKEKFLFEI